MGDPRLNWLETVDHPAPEAEMPPVYGDADLEEIGVPERRPRALVDEVVARVTQWLRPALPLGPRRELLLSAAVLAAVMLAFWLTRWPLANWPGSAPDLGLYVLHPIIWIGVAALAGYGWLRLENPPEFRPVLTGAALVAGFLHVIALVIAGAAGSFVDSPVVDWLLDYPFNILYLFATLAAAEVARSYLFEVWRRVDRSGAYAAVAGIFALAALSAEEVTPFSSLGEFAEVAGGRWIPVLAISILATSLVEVGGPAGSFAYRIAVGGFAWLSPALPDVHWGVLAGIGIALPWAAWRIIRAVHNRVEIDGAAAEPKAQHPPGVWAVPSADRSAQRSPMSRLWSIAKGILGTIVTLGVVLATLLLVFGSGVTGYRLQVVDDDSMAPAYERGDSIMIDEQVRLATLDVGDVIRVVDTEGTEVRRIVRIIETTDEELLFVTAEDNAGGQRMVTEDEVAGEVTLRIPNLGFPALWWRD